MKGIFYYLGTCDTCQRILKSLDLPEGITLHDIKKMPLNAPQVGQLQNAAGSYEALFSKRARLYTSRNLKEKNLSESDYKALLLEHYTFLKRPVLLLGDQIFIGNSKKVVDAMKATLSS